MKTKFITICLALVALAQQVNAQQSLVWKKQLPNPYAGKYYQVFTDSQDNVYSIVDGGLIAGETQRRIYKSNASGDTLWGVSTPNYIYDAAVDNAGNLYLGGNMKAGTAWKAKVMKVSPAGVVLWDNIYLDTEYSFDEIHDIEVDPTDGSVYIALKDYTFNGWSATSKGHIFTVAKINTSGTQLWKYSYSGPIHADAVGYRRVMLDAAYNPIIICNVNINPTYPYISTAVYAAKFNPAGAMQWDTIMRSPTAGVLPYQVISTNCKEAMLDANNDLFFIGDSTMHIKYTKISGVNGDILYTKLLPVSNGGSNLQLIKGNKPYIIATRNGGGKNLYEISATGDTTLKTQITSPNATYTLNTLYDTKRINNKLYLNYRIYDAVPPQGNNIHRFMVLRINESNFQQDWSMDYATPYGVNNYFWADASDNVYVSRDTVGAANARRFITEKHNSNTQNVVGIRDNIQAQTIGLYPNPASDELNINLADNNSDAEITIYDAQLQLQAVVKGNARTIDISSLPQGFYVLRVSMQGKQYSGKFIKK